jgi:MscS family membrane protein
MQANGISGFRRLTDRGFSHSEPLRYITTWIPNSLKRLYGEQTLWQWIALGLGTAITFAVVSLLLGWWLQVGDQMSSQWMSLGVRILVPLLLLMVNGAQLTWIRLINITGDLGQWLEQVEHGITFLLWGWLVYAGLNLVGVAVVQVQQLQAKPLEAVIVRNAMRLVGVLAAITVIYQGAESLGLPVAPLLASLGPVVWR